MAINMYKPKDFSTRFELVDNIYGNYFVIAGAGSGKTTILVERMVSIIEKGRCTVDQICAITFTKKAASEFYNRFYKRLNDRSNLIPGTKGELDGFLGDANIDTIKKCKEALNNIDKCFLGTIDAFCNKVLKEYPSLCGVDPNSTILTDAFDKNIVLSKELDNIANGLYDDGVNNLQEKFFKYKNVIKNAKNVFIRNIDTFLTHQDYNIQYYHPDLKDPVFNGLISKLNDIKSQIKNILEFLVKSGLKVELAKSENFESNKSILLSDWQEKDFEQVIHAFDDIFYVYDSSLDFDKDKVKIKILKDISSMKIIDSSPYKSNFYDFVFGKSAVDYYGFTVDPSLNLKEVIDSIRYSYAIDFFVSATPYIHKSLVENGTMTFYQNLLMIRDALKKSCLVKDHLLIDTLKRKYKTFLIDESQDTNPLQSEIFFYLTTTNYESQWYDNKPDKGSLFIVGDPKQSIYRFQGADISSYNFTKGLFASFGGIKFLDCNFRSSSPLKNYFNNTFDTMFIETPTTPIKQCKYDSINNESDPKTKSTLSNPVYEVCAKYNAGAETVSSLVSNLVHSKIQFTDVKIDDLGNAIDKNAIDISCGDIMIVPNSKQHKVSKITRLLHEKKIPCYAEGEISFRNCKSLIYLYYLYRYIIIRDNESLGGLIFSDYYKYSFDHIASVYNKKRDIASFQEKIDSSLESIIKEKFTKPSHLLEVLLNDLDLFAKINNDYLTELYNAIELLKDAENNGSVISFEDGIDFLEKLLFDTDVERITQLSTDKNYVTVSNLHKVKGLQSRIVILYGMTGNNKKEPSNSFDRISNIGHIFSLSSYGNFNACETNMYSTERTNEDEFNDAELIRLVYVGATRARNNLFIVNEYSKNDPDKPHSSNFYKELVTKEVIKMFDETSMKETLETDTDTFSPSSVVDSDSKETDPSEFNNKPTYNLSRPSDTNSKTIDLVDPETNQTYRTKEEKERAEIGIKTHALLKKIVDLTKNKKIKVQMDVEELVNNMFDKYQKELIQMGNTFITQGFDQNGIVNKYPYNNLFEHIKDLDEVYTEIPFSYKEGMNIVYGVIDLLYKDNNGKWIIVDYKTNLSTKDIYSHYKSQLDIYEKAAKDILGLDVKNAYIYHIDIK